MDFLCVLQLQPKYKIRDNWSAFTNQIMGDHWNYLVKLQGEGKIKFVARTDYQIENDANRGYAVYVAPSENEARALMMSDPCVANNVMLAEMHPLTVFMLGKELFQH